MLKRSIAALSLLGLLLLTPTYTGAQVTGVAFVAYGQGNIFEGFIGPWRPTPAGMDISYTVMCYDTIQTPRRRVGGEVIASIPDGSTLANIRTLSTTAIVDACAAQGVTVPRGAVLLPQVINGQ